MSILTLGSDSGTTVAGLSLSGGNSLAELRGPTAIFVTLNGIMYIVDGGNHRIQQWRIGEPMGFTVAGGHGSGSALNQMSTCYGIYVDTLSNIYVSDYGNHRVVLWEAGNTTTSRLVSFARC